MPREIQYSGESGADFRREADVSSGLASLGQGLGQLADGIMAVEIKAKNALIKEQIRAGKLAIDKAYAPVNTENSNSLNYENSQARTKSAYDNSMASISENTDLDDVAADDLKYYLESSNLHSQKIYDSTRAKAHSQAALALSTQSIEAAIADKNIEAINETLADGVDGKIYTPEGADVIRTESENMVFHDTAVDNIMEVDMNDFDTTAGVYKQLDEIVNLAREADLSPRQTQNIEAVAVKQRNAIQSEYNGILADALKLKKDGDVVTASKMIAQLPEGAFKDQAKTSLRLTTESSFKDSTSILIEHATSQADLDALEADVKANYEKGSIQREAMLAKIKAGREDVGTTGDDLTASDVTTLLSYATDQNALDKVYEKYKDVFPVGSVEHDKVAGRYRKAEYDLAHGAIPVKVNQKKMNALMAKIKSGDLQRGQIDNLKISDAEKTALHDYQWSLIQENRAKISANNGGYDVSIAKGSFKFVTQAKAFEYAENRFDEIQLMNTDGKPAITAYVSETQPGGVKRFREKADVKGYGKRKFKGTDASDFLTDFIMALPTGDAKDDLMYRYNDWLSDGRNTILFDGMNRNVQGNTQFSEPYLKEYTSFSGVFNESEDQANLYEINNEMRRIYNNPAIKNKEAEAVKVIEKYERKASMNAFQESLNVYGNASVVKRQAYKDPKLDTELDELLGEF